MLEKAKKKITDITGWLEEPYLEDRTVGRALLEAFFQGSGEAAWVYVAVVGIICLITGRRVRLVKK